VRSCAGASYGTIQAHRADTINEKSGSSRHRGYSEWGRGETSDGTAGSGPAGGSGGGGSGGVHSLIISGGDKASEDGSLGSAGDDTGSSSRMRRRRRGVDPSPSPPPPLEELPNTSLLGRASPRVAATVLTVAAAAVAAAASELNSAPPAASPPGVKRPRHLRISALPASSCFRASAASNAARTVATGRLYRSLTRWHRSWSSGSSGR